MQNTSLAEIDSFKTDDKLIARAAGRWFFVGMALLMIATSIAGFLPAIIEPSTRRAPLTLLAEAQAKGVFGRGAIEILLISISLTGLVYFLFGPTLN